MTILQCGFLASGPSQAGIEPGCSKDIASPLPVPVSVDVQLVKAHPGGWGFALASTADSTLYAWGVNQATLLGKSGAPHRRPAAPPACLPVPRARPPARVCTTLRHQSPPSTTPPSPPPTHPACRLRRRGRRPKHPGPRCHRRGGRRRRV
jgi:hypothetical protein